jgi:hypothetical protein
LLLPSSFSFPFFLLFTKVTKISKTNQEQSNDLTNIQTEMNGMLTEALHSAALATTFSGSNGSTIGDFSGNFLHRQLMIANYCVKKFVRKSQ